MLKQTDILIANYLDKPYGITSSEAQIKWSIGRLASRMCDIKKLGYEVYSEMETGKNQFGETISYKRYWIRSGSAQK